jgi:hypothetical protein
MHGSLVTSSLIRETTENESANEGYRFGQEEETYNIVETMSQREEQKLPRRSMLQSVSHCLPPRYAVTEFAI